MTLSLRFQQTSSFKLILQNPCQIVLVMFVLMGTELQLVSHSFAGLANKDTIDHTRFSFFHLVQESQDIKEIAANCSKHSKAFEGLKQIRIERASFHRFEHQFLNQNKCGAHSLSTLTGHSII